MRTGTVPGVAGLYARGASTAPVGGIAGSSGKHAALQLLKRERGRRMLAT